MSLWTMGINQQTWGTVAVNQICSLHLTTAQIGRPGAGPFPVTAQPSMDFRQAGGGPSLPGYRALTNAGYRQPIANAWGIDVRDLPEATLTAARIREAVGAGDIRFLDLRDERGDLSRWVREVLTDPALPDGIGDVERDQRTLHPDASNGTCRFRDRVAAGRRGSRVLGWLSTARAPTFQPSMRTWSETSGGGRGGRTPARRLWCRAWPP